MKNLIVYYEGDDLRTRIEDVPLWTITDDEVLIKVVAAGANPKDYKHPKRFNVQVNQGDDVGGIVEAVGKHVKNFRKGDRVAGFHVMDAETGGTYGEYAVCPGQTVFHIPDSMSFEEAATFPLAAYTAAVALYRNLELPLPVSRADDAAPLTEKLPLIVNAASGAVGAFAVQLAKLNPRISPVIGIAGASADYAKKVGCDIVINYRDDNVAEQLLKALGGKKALYVFDCFNTLASTKYFLDVLDLENGRYTNTSAPPDWDKQEELLKQSGVWWDRVWVGSVHEDHPAGGKMFGAIMSRIFEIATEEGRFKGQPYTIVPGGLNGVQDALLQLKSRGGGNTKFIVRVDD